MVILGAKGFAKEVLEILIQNNFKKEIFFFDDVSHDAPDLMFNKYKLLKDFEGLRQHFLHTDNTFTLGVGNPIIRKKLYDKTIKIGGLFTSTISPYARIGHFDNIVGDGVNIMTGAIITNSIRIGKGCLLNLNCTVGHDSVIGEFVECSPGVNISGNCSIGDYCNLGTNALILPKVKLGSNVIVGAGAVITKDIPDNCLVMGMPATIKKELSPLSFNFL